MMVTRVFKQMMRRPLSMLIMLCFSAVLTGVLCGLNAMNLAEERKFEETYNSIPVSVTLTDLTGQKTTDMEAERWVYDAFTSEYVMGSYLKDINMKMSVDIGHGEYDGENCGCTKLIGITSVKSDPGLYQKGEQSITWREGYDPSVLTGSDLVCIVPQGLLADLDSVEGSIDLTYQRSITVFGEVQEWTYQCTLCIVGTHSYDSNLIYCPLLVTRKAASALEDEGCLDSVSATLKDNHLLDEFWDAAGKWFVKPNPMGTKTPWKYSYYTSYPYALVVDDAQLTAATEALEKSMQINQVCTAIIFALAVAASFLVGFLTVRNRKREIMLMRTLGTGNGQVYLEFVLEQMGCVLLGILLGGIWFLWRPVWRLAAFAGIYFVGLTLSLLIFMGTSLISTMKEDE